MREWHLVWPDYVRSPNVFFTDWDGTGRKPSFFHILYSEWKLWGPFAKYTGFCWKHLIPKRYALERWGWKAYFRYPLNHLKWKTISWLKMLPKTYALISGDAVLTENIR